MVSRVRKLPPQTRFVSVFDLFRIGIGPSSSHTVGPMRAAQTFMAWAAAQATSVDADRVTCDLFGSLALTGVGHGTDGAVILGLCGRAPETIDPDKIPAILDTAKSERRVSLGPTRLIAFDPAEDLHFRRKEFLPGHPNALRFALWQDKRQILSRNYYSIGGGFVQAEGDADRQLEQPPPRYPFALATELLSSCKEHGLTIAELSRANECGYRTDPEVNENLDCIWAAMTACISRGLKGTGILPGGLGVKRRAAALHQALIERDRTDQGDPLRAMEWVNLFALAVNEENAAGGRVVTAPTNGAAGIIPAVVRYYERFVTEASTEGIRDFFLTAAAIGSIIKRNASISGADVGCQGEVGSAAAMAAAGLAAALGGTNEQIENAAEIALEHNLGLTCDPVGGLVQVPCIERNAVGAVKAINAARLALHGDGIHRVSLDQAIETMRQTGRDMKRKYKETSLGGLAVNVPLC
jgi:L-serine dehydratase